MLPAPSIAAFQHFMASNARLLAYALAAHLSVKLIPFPLCIPLSLAAAVAFLVVHASPTQRAVVCGLIALQFSPLMLAGEKKLSDIEAWAGKGPLKADAPIKGVYLVEGLVRTTTCTCTCTCTCT